MDGIIPARTLRRIAVERKLGLDLIEKDYALGWVLRGISNTSAGDKLVFKGGTALSKLYYPLEWRISEDLDYTVKNNADMETLWSILQDQLPGAVQEESGGITLQLKNPYILPSFLRVAVTMTGPITRHRTKIELTRESYLGEIEVVNAPAIYDTPEYSLHSYTLNNILAEKLRSLMERTKIRDFYDVWKLLKLGGTDSEKVKVLFKGKCRGKAINIKTLDQVFHQSLSEIMEPYMDTLTRLTTESVPPLNRMLDELKALLEQSSLFMQS